MLSIVFSMDRAMQLEAFLRSMSIHFKDEQHIVVLYKYSNDEYKKGYDIVREKYPNYGYMLETDIKKDMVQIFKNQKSNRYVVFYCDDNIWKDDFSLNDESFKKFERNPKAICYSIRMHPGVKKCYPMGNIDTPPPIFIEPYVWSWKGLKGDWGYPMSIDGHIFRSDLVSIMMEHLPYQNVNQIEAFMSAQHPMLSNMYPLMVCGPKSGIVNIPLNRVQTNTPNIHMDVNQKMLNDKFLDSYRININKLKGIIPVSPHQEIDISFEKD